MYLVLKLLHVSAVVAFLGNIITGLYWHRLALRTRDPRLLHHAMDGILKEALAQRWELWGAVALLLPLAAFVLMILKP